MEKIFKTELAGRPLVVETGKLAQFTNGACLIRYGETAILSTVTASKTPREGVDFFPLSVDYEEKMYAVGKIPGGYIKREGRPSEKAILTSRVIDRPIRPLFPKDLRNDVVVSNMVMSVDQDCSPEIAAMIGTSIAIAISDIPWNGPVGGVVLGLIGDDVIINPTEEQRKESRMYVTLAGTAKKICMVEAGANEVPDETMLEAIAIGHESIKESVKFINSIVAEIGKEKFTYESADVPEEVFTLVKDFAWEKMRQAVLAVDKSVRDANIEALTKEIEEYLTEQNEEYLPYLADAVYKLEKKVVRNYLFKEHVRVDGRRLDEIRPLSCDVGLLPRVHGSGLFQRGQTQVMTTCTLAPLSYSQTLDGLDNEETKRYMHYYNMPGYSVGQLYTYPTGGIDPETGHRIFFGSNGEWTHYDPMTKKWYLKDGTEFKGDIAQVRAGNTLPTWFGGWSNNFKYKGFDLNFMFQFSGGNWILNAFNATGSDNRWWNNLSEVADKCWKQPGDNAKYAYPVYGDNVSNGSAYEISDWIEKGDYLRLKNIGFGYTFKPKKSENSISSIRAYAQIQNVFVLTAFTGLDPEITSSYTSQAVLSGGYYKNTLPQARTYTLGVQISF